MITLGGLAIDVYVPKLADLQVGNAESRVLQCLIVNDISRLKKDGDKSKRSKNESQH